MEIKVVLSQHQINRNYLFLKIDNTMVTITLQKTPSHLTLSTSLSKCDLSLNFINKKCPRFGFFGIVRNSMFNQKALFIGVVSFRIVRY